MNKKTKKRRHAQFRKLAAARLRERDELARVVGRLRALLLRHELAAQDVVLHGNRLFAFLRIEEPPNYREGVRRTRIAARAFQVSGGALQRCNTFDREIHVDVSKDLLAYLDVGEVLKMKRAHLERAAAELGRGLMHELWGTA